MPVFFVSHPLVNQHHESKRAAALHKKGVVQEVDLVNTFYPHADRISVNVDSSVSDSYKFIVKSIKMAVKRITKEVVENPRMLQIFCDDGTWKEFTGLESLEGITPKKSGRLGDVNDYYKLKWIDQGFTGFMSKNGML